MGFFAVIDTETNWADQVMSIGTVIADEHFQAVEARYHILTPEYTIGGMYYDVLEMDMPFPPIVCSRAEAMEDLLCWLKRYGVRDVYAYNAAFDRNHMPEFAKMRWHDIMRLAAYRQHNAKIPRSAECFSTGRLKRGYGVEAMLRLLSGNRGYCETHNALYDALDELGIMRLLGHGLDAYLIL